MHQSCMKFLRMNNDNNPRLSKSRRRPNGPRVSVIDVVLT